MEGVGEHAALLRDAVDVRGLHVRMPGYAGLVEAQVIDQDHDEIGFLCHFRFSAWKKLGGGRQLAGPRRSIRDHGQIDLDRVFGELYVLE